MEALDTSRKVRKIPPGRVLREAIGLLRAEAGACLGYAALLALVESARFWSVGAPEAWSWLVALVASAAMVVVYLTKVLVPIGTTHDNWPTNLACSATLGALTVTFLAVYCVWYVRLRDRAAEEDGARAAVAEGGGDADAR